MQTQAFARAVSIANQTVHRRNAIPILGQLRLSARPDGKVRISGTDMDRQVDVEIDGELEQDTMLPMATRVVRALGAAGNGEFKIAPLPQDRQGITIKSGDFNIELDSALPVRDFPGKLDTMIVDHSAEVGLDFIKALRTVYGAVSREETRYYLNGVYMHKTAEPWGFTLVCTDGHRMYMKNIQVPGLGDFKPIIIPRAVCDLVFATFDKRVGDSPITFSVGRRLKRNEPDGDLIPDDRSVPRVRFNAKVGDCDVTITGLTIDGSFPDYSRVIPKDWAAEATFKTADLRRAVLGLSAGHSDRGHSAIEIQLLRDLAKLTTRWGAHEGKAMLQVPYEGDVWHKPTCGGNTFGLNSRYLLDAINTVNGAEEFRFRFSAQGIAVSPMLIEAKGMDDFKAVLMPMRV
jgi:DNA polymerase-3 subunit beta